MPSVMGVAEYRGVDLAPDGRTLTYWRWESATNPGRIHQLDIATKVDRELRFDPSDYTAKRVCCTRPTAPRSSWAATAARSRMGRRWGRS